MLARWVLLELLLHVKDANDSLQVLRLLSERLLEVNVIVFHLLDEVLEECHVLILRSLVYFFIVKRLERLLRVVGDKLLEVVRFLVILQD